MNEFEAGTLKSSSGEVIKDPRQAMAIALSEAGVSKEGKSDECSLACASKFNDCGETNTIGEKKILSLKDLQQQSD